MQKKTYSSLLVLTAVLGVWSLASGQGLPGQRNPGGRPTGPAPGASGFPSAVPPPPTPPTPFKPADGAAAPTPAETLTFKNPKGGVTIGLQEADLPELVNWIGSLTGKRFIYGSKIKQLKVTLYSPVPVTVDEAYRSFLVALETNGLTVVPHGKFLKIIETTGVAGEATPVYGTSQPVPAEDRFITRLYRLQHVSADEVGAVLGKFKSKEGDVSTYSPGNLLIITDTGSNIRRMLQIVEEVDVGTAGDQVWIEPIYYGTASDVSQRLGELFDVGKGGGSSPPPAAAPKGGSPPGGSPGGGSSGGGGGGGSVGDRATKIVPDDRTNSLIIVAPERAYRKILEVIKHLDIPRNGEGEIHVVALQHAQAEELAPVIGQILGTGGATPTPPSGGGRNNQQGQQQGGQQGGGAVAGAGQVPAGIFEGNVRVTPDKSTNSLVILSSLRDYAQIRTLVQKLDQPRRQVFIEAVIMDVTVSTTDKLSANYHAGAELANGDNGPTVAYGGLNPLTTISPIPSQDQLTGLALGVRGPDLTNTVNRIIPGISIPAFGVILNALTSNRDANILSTPHVLATDNTPAEISVGQNIPTQVNSGGLGSLASLAGAAGGQGAGALGGLGGLGALGGLGGGFNAPRADVATKVKVTPHMNDSNEVRLELQEEISEQAGDGPAGQLGAISIKKNLANTNLVVKDQQTVVIGGLMRDTLKKTVDKVPVLGDIPLLGALFRSTKNEKAKSNLLLILTPHIIRDQNDLKAVFERKMQERQEFLDRYFVFSDQTPYDPPKDFSRLNGLLEDIRQAFLAFDEKKRLTEAAKPRDRKIHEASEPIDMPDISKPASGGVTPNAPAGTPPTNLTPGAAPTPATQTPAAPNATPPNPTPPGTIRLPLSSEKNTAPEKKE